MENRNREMFFVIFEIRTNIIYFTVRVKFNALICRDLTYNNTILTRYLTITTMFSILYNCSRNREKIEKLIIVCLSCDRQFIY